MIPWSQIVEAVLLSFGTAAASITITKSKFFKPLRMWILDLAFARIPEDERPEPTETQTSKEVWYIFLYRKETKEPVAYTLISCPYCMSHWIAALGVAVFGTNVMGDPAAAGYIVTWLCVITLSSLLGGLVLRSYEE